MSDHAHEAHTGPIKTPAQLLWLSFFSFVGPIFIIIGLVVFVTSATKPTSGVLSQADEVNAQVATAKRIARVGSVVVQEAPPEGTVVVADAAAAPVDAAAAAAPAAAPADAAAPAPVAAVPAAAAVAVVAAGGGEALYKKACAACHIAGVANAPKLGDKAAWAPRLGAGLDGLTASVIKGKGAMPPKGGSGASDEEIKAAVEYMLAAVK